jgi:hypothetical protein
MTTKHASRAVKLFSAVLMFAGVGAAQAVTTDFGAVTDGSYGFGRSVGFGETFTDYVNFNLNDSADVSSFIKSFDMSIFNFDLLGIDNFTTGLQRLGGSGFTTLASLTSNPASFDDQLPFLGGRHGQWALRWPVSRHAARSGGSGSGHVGHAADGLRHRRVSAASEAALARAAASRRADGVKAGTFTPLSIC